MPYVSNRWLGGTLTNFATIQARIDHLVRLEDQRERGEFDRLPKKEALKIDEEVTRLNRYLGGIKEMTKLPGALFVVDPSKERIAIAEALRMDVQVVAMVDTNCNPDEIDFPIPSNDDAIRAIKFMSNSIASAALEGLAAREFAAKEALEEVEVGAYQETGYVASPDEEPPSRGEPAEPPAAAGPAAPAAEAPVAPTEAAESPPPEEKQSTSE
jgi:small subunit ribosomal protein S2